MLDEFEHYILELVSKELNHFGVIADLFRQIGGHTLKSLIEEQTGINEQAWKESAILLAYY